VSADDPADDPADVAVTELTASADGSIHASLEVQMGAQEPEDPPKPGDDEPGPDVVVGVAKAAGNVLGAAWDVLRPSE
jgi:hypothetical protein